MIRELGSTVWLLRWQASWLRSKVKDLQCLSSKHIRTHCWIPAGLIVAKVHLPPLLLSWKTFPGRSLTPQWTRPVHTTQCPSTATAMSQRTILSLVLSALNCLYVERISKVDATCNYIKLYMLSLWKVYASNCSELILDQIFHHNTWAMTFSVFFYPFWIYNFLVMITITVIDGHCFTCY